MLYDALNRDIQGLGRYRQTRVLAVVRQPALHKTFRPTAQSRTYIFELQSALASLLKGGIVPLVIQHDILNDDSSHSPNRAEYTIHSPQGATVLIYGHDNGVTLVWRGGRRLKPVKKEPPKEKQNGTVEDTMMIIDSDDDEPQTKPPQAQKFVDKPQFEQALEQGPYPEIVQTLDLALGTAVLNVAVLPVTPCSADEASDGTTTFLTKHMAFVVSCVTNDVYVITVPLTPPSHESKARSELRHDLLAGRAGSGIWGETLTLLGGQTNPSKGIAINLVTAKPGERTQANARAVVASHSWEASGVLRFWEVPLEPTRKSDRSIEPFQTEFLPSSLGSISFNPTYSTQLLVTSPSQGVRIYDFAQSPFPPDPDATGPYPAQGSWLLTLYQPFARQSSHRKPVLDAAWIAHGRAVFVLLGDGSWGIWDIQGASPASSGTSISTKLLAGVRGAAITAFSASGYVDGTGSLRSVVTQHKASNSGDFAPMTPHTRRQATASLGSASTSNRLATIRGGVKVMALPSAGKALQDECVALWIGSLEHVCVIPGVSRFWDSQLRKGATGTASIFTGTQTTRMIKLLDLSTGLLGDRCCGVRLVLNPTQGGQLTHDGALPVDLLVQGESRFLVVREGEEGVGKKVGGVLGNRRNRLFSGDKTSAIIVHGKSASDANMTFNLSTVKPGTLRKKSSRLEDSQHFTEKEDQLPASRSQTGFEFASTLNAAADVSEDLTKRDVEAEMLDIMEIDQALEAINGRQNGRKRVFFEDD
ncbi:Nucleoporin NUP37 [Paramyrothecium foliicola]|nr:Nucleoporin NUP37 [Paramyrothecium foliicola]